jgi:hypothetical protein
VNYDQEWLDERTDRWKKRLRVQDWNTEVSFARRWELGEDRHAQLRYAALQEARDHPGDGPPGRRRTGSVRGNAPERALIHELVHLLIEPMLNDHHHDDESAEYYAMEQAVDALAGALWGMEMELREAKG